MPTKDEVELDFITDKLSTQVRTVALGILVFVWGLLVGQSSTTLNFAKSWKSHLIGLGGAAVFVMLLDFLQYVAGFCNVYRHQQTGATRDYKSFYVSYYLRLSLFCAKIVVLIAITGWLLGVIALWLHSSQ